MNRLLLLIAFVLTLGGCAAALPVFQEADSLAKDGEFALVVAKGLADAYFSTHPNPSAEATAKKLEGDAMLALSTIEELAAGGADMSGGNGNLTDAILAFQASFGDLEKLLASLGVVAPRTMSVAVGDSHGARTLPHLPRPRLMDWHPKGSK